MDKFVNRTFYANIENIIIACRFAEFKVRKPIGYEITVSLKLANGNNFYIGRGYIGRSYHREMINIYSTKEDAVENKSEKRLFYAEPYFGVRSDLRDLIESCYELTKEKNARWGWDGVKAVKEHFAYVDFVSGKFSHYVDGLKSHYKTKEECEMDNQIQYIDFPNEDNNANEETLRKIEETEKKMKELQNQLTELKKSLK